MQLRFDKVVKFNGPFRTVWDVQRDMRHKLFIKLIQVIGQMFFSGTQQFNAADIKRWNHLFDAIAQCGLSVNL